LPIAATIIWDYLLNDPYATPYKGAPIWNHTMTLSIQPMQWSNLPDLHQTPPLDDSDLECLADIRDVLARHGVCGCDCGKSSFTRCRLLTSHIRLFHIAYDSLPAVIDVDVLDPDVLLRAMTEATKGFNLCRIGPQ
jgi:hypothetical protein